MTLAPWLKIGTPDQQKLRDMLGLLASLNVNTICTSAKCPNAGECFAQGTATFLILGPNCTRNCRFCAVNHGRLAEPDPLEPAKVAQAVQILDLKYVVITSVTRDDLPDYGAGQFAAVIREIKALHEDTLVEVLIPDLTGEEKALALIVQARPDVLGHNLETVPRLYAKVRPQASYRQSLRVLKAVKEMKPGMLTKSSLMLGLGETEGELREVFQDLKEVDCDILTLGQYLQPTPQQLPVERYVTPEEFSYYREIALSLGIREVYAGPLVRSSYHAREVFRTLTDV
ncbi:lipoyl synthase [Thermanaerosceptrum fracticalcis]|uniref:Lipoyl synthase n=1 Tax=Thermanaerosceptrum fracticalcis TaxID=1712410 RepID=A0A7G6E6U9_THEFR|nr:lipoyl synthase [Thermanaerosceptrum fracticalcis]QNB47803.1 lipoyl synthase [Thermanaerosceptrum fracticalcis]